MKKKFLSLKAQSLDTLEPRKSIGMEWLVHLRSTDFKLDEKVVKFVRSAKLSLSETRKGIIGEYIQKNF